MTGTKECTGPYVGLSLTSIALLISVCLNILLYSLRRKDRQNRDLGVLFYQDSCHIERFEEEEQNQDNPIYGNIFVDVGGSLQMPDCDDYEQMTKRDVGHDEKSDAEDVSYASLDLKLVQKKRKKKRRYQEKKNTIYKVQTHTPPVGHLKHIEMGADCDDALPSRTSSLIMSRSSIYLNSHQVALETEELQREREREKEREVWKCNHE